MISFLILLWIVAFVSVFVILGLGFWLWMIVDIFRHLETKGEKHEKP